jgi:ATPase subunit of ABC transporter with duplicated ATPase domains
MLMTGEQYGCAKNTPTAILTSSVDDKEGTLTISSPRIAVIAQEVDSARKLSLFSHLLTGNSDLHTLTTIRTSS